jgi:hypothetical protein
MEFNLASNEIETKLVLTIGPADSVTCALNTVKDDILYFFLPLIIPTLFS